MSVQCVHPPVGDVSTPLNPRRAPVWSVACFLCQVLRRDMRRFDTAEVEDVVYEGEEKQSPDVFKYLLDKLWTDVGAYKGKRVLAERRNKIENQPVSLGLLERWSDGSLQVPFSRLFFKPVFPGPLSLRAPPLPALVPPPPPPPHPPPLFHTSLAVPRDGVHGAGRARRHPAHPLRARRGRHHRRVQRRGPGAYRSMSPPSSRRSSSSPSG